MARGSRQSRVGGLRRCHAASVALILLPAQLRDSAVRPPRRLLALRQDEWDPLGVRETPAQNSVLIRSRDHGPLSVRTQELIGHAQVKLVAYPILIQVEGMFAVRDADTLDLNPCLP